MTRADFEARAQATRADIEAQMRATKAQIDATNEKILARTGRNLVAAIAIGIGLGALLIASLIIFPWLFIIFAGFLIGFTVFELSSALRFAGRDVPRVASIVVGVAVAPLAFFCGVTGLWLGVLGGDRRRHALARRRAGAAEPPRLGARAVLAGSRGRRVRPGVRRRSWPASTWCSPDPRAASGGRWPPS